MNFSARRTLASALVALFFSISPALKAQTQAPSKEVPAPAKTDVVVIGAGLSGLATSYYLKRQGISSHILELTPRIGGRVRTVTYQFPGEPKTFVDSGMEEYWASNPAVGILKELKLETSHDVAITTLMLEGKLEELGNSETQAQFHQKLFSKEDFAAFQKFKTEVGPIVHDLHEWKPVSKDLMKLKDQSFSDYLEKKGLSKRVREWIRVSIECEIGTSLKRISALDGLAEMHIFMGEGEECYRVAGGNQKLTDALGRAVGMTRISLNKRVNRIVSTANGVEVYYLDNATNVISVVKAKYVVSTVPIFRLFEVQFVPPLSPRKQEAMRTQTWGSYFKAHVFVPPSASKYWEKDGESILPILSDSELGVIYDGNADQKAKTKVLSLLITGDHAESYNLMPLDLVRSIIESKMDKLWPGIGKEIKGIEFYRYHPRAIAAWPVGRSRYDDLSEEIRTPANNVYLGGDFTMTSHSDGAFLSAKRITDDIVKKIKAKK